MLVDLGHAPHHLERAFVLAAVVQRQDVVDAAALEAHQVAPFDQVPVRQVRRHVLDLGLVQARRQHIDQVQRAEQFAVFAVGDAGGNKDAQVSHGLVQAVDDHLVVGDQFLIGGVQIRDPVQRLLRRRDVVPPGRENDHRRTDVAQVHHGLAVAAAHLARGQPVADEQVLHDPVDLRAVHQEVAAPPALELQEARAFRVRLGVDVIELLPQRVGRIELLEVLHQPGTVEAAIAHVGGQRGQKRAAQQPAAVAHRVAPAHARPVRQRCAGHQQWPGALGRDRGQDHQCPAGLAVADDEGLAGCVRVPLADDLEEVGLGARHRFNRLPRAGLLEEGDEIARMPGAQRDADLAVGLEATDAGAVARARVNHHEGALGRVGRAVGRRHDAQQRVVDGFGQFAAVGQQFLLEHEHRRHALALMLGGLVAALAQDVEQQHGALPGVGEVFQRRLAERRERIGCFWGLRGGG
ncbi:hypothetical protein D9M72_305910 [compost metagenome]